MRVEDGSVRDDVAGMVVRLGIEFAMPLRLSDPLGVKGGVKDGLTRGGCEMLLGRGWWRFCCCCGGGVDGAVEPLVDVVVVLLSECKSYSDTVRPS